MESIVSTSRENLNFKTTVLLPGGFAFFMKQKRSVSAISGEMRRARKLELSALMASLLLARPS